MTSFYTTKEADFSLAEFSVVARLQLPEFDRSNRNTSKAHYAMPNPFKHSPDLSISTLCKGDFKPAVLACLKLTDSSGGEYFIACPQPIAKPLEIFR
jgi:hypothetical protein